VRTAARQLYRLIIAPIEGQEKPPFEAHVSRAPPISWRQGQPDAWLDGTAAI